VGEPRAFVSRVAQRRHSSAKGQAKAKAILTRRALIFTSAPSFRSVSRIVSQVACAPPMPRKVHKST
jgi:hypothetical protein